MVQWYPPETIAMYVSISIPYNGEYECMGVQLVKPKAASQLEI